MEKQAKYQDKILKFLPKAAAVVTFHHSLPFSPNRDKRFSGPINVPMIPHEARIRRPKSFNHRKGNYNHDDGDQDDQEPTSPKISCMGQIKHKNKKIINNKNKRVAKESKPVTWSPREVKKQAFALKRMLSSAIKPGRKSSASACNSSSVDEHDHHDRDDHYSSISRPNSLPDRAPALSQMRRFASGRDSMAGFDWAAAVQVAPVDADHRKAHYSDEDDDDRDRDFDDVGDYRDDVMIPFSAPIAIGSESASTRNEVPLQPRKEINLWKRRTMTPPRPLDLNTMMIRAN